MSNRKWSVIFLSTVIIMLGLGGTFTIIIDPYFHYHMPLDFFQYPMEDERYQNDGIIKNFNYNAIITGTSMTQNFKTSEADEIFGFEFIKIPFAGAYYKEIKDNLVTAINKKPSIECVIWGLDYNRILSDKDTMRYDVDFYPFYLYDDKWYNDVNYIFNKDILLNYTCNVILYTCAGGRTPTFDEYRNWAQRFELGKSAVMSDYVRPDKEASEIKLLQSDYERIKENLEENIVSLAYKNPQIDFYIFLTPYSICYWDKINQDGTIRRQLEAEKAIIELLLDYDNIFLFSFFDDYDMICNLDNYRDYLHYGEHINSQILYCMGQGQHLITKDNYQDYCKAEHDFYITYNYEMLFESY